MRVNASGAQAYRQQAEFASRSSDRDIFLSPSSQAKSTTTTFGLNLGKFRVKYTDKNISFDSEQVAHAAYRVRRRSVEQAFAESMEVENERTRSFDTRTADPEPLGSLHRRKAALLAYEKNATHAGPARPGVLIGVV